MVPGLLALHPMEEHGMLEVSLSEGDIHSLEKDPASTAGLLGPQTAKLQTQERVDPC